MTLRFTTIAAMLLALSLSTSAQEQGTRWSTGQWQYIPTSAGWIFLGLVEGETADTTQVRWAEADPGFVIVGSERAVDRLPTQGEWLRLTADQPLVIVNYKHSAEKELLTSPTS